ncbi:MAG: DUF5055 domain-containing protein [Eubacteriales bacterium]|jgi:hypothetical protein
MPRTTLDFEYEGKSYSLAYTIDVVKRLDRAGILAQIANGERPLTMTEDLFIAAFEANHSTVSNNIRRKIFEEFSESSEDGSLLECLLEMLNEVREAMAPKGNIKWRMNRGDKI